MSKELNYLNIYLPALSGILLILIFPRFDLEILGWIALVPLLLSIIIARDFKQAFRSGFITGFIYFLGTIYWVVNSIYYYGHMSFFLSVLLLLVLVTALSLFIGLFSIVCHITAKRVALPLSLLSPVIWTTVELARTYAFSGFPWSSLGYSQYKFLPAIQIADITGVFGVSFLIVMVNGAIVDFLIYKKLKKPYFLLGTAFSIIILVAAIGYGFSNLGKTDLGKVLKVGIVQGNIEQGRKWDPKYQREVFDTYLRLTKEVVKENPDIIVWPETATPFYYKRDRFYTDELINFVKDNKIYLLFGTQRVKSFEKGKYSITNSAYFLSPAGEIAGSYDKMHLVPFGEYVPLKKALFFVDKLVEGIGDFSTGNRYEIFETPKGRFGTVICYEIIFPGLVRKFVKGGAEFMITITNDAWFGRTSAPYQHFSMAVLRAVENRVPVARAANTGISGFIDRDGRILKNSGIFKEDAFTLDIKLSDKKTFYTRNGDIFAYLCLALTLVFFLIAIVNRKRR